MSRKNPAEFSAGPFTKRKKRDRKRSSAFESSGSRLPLDFHGFILKGKYDRSLSGMKTLYDKNVNRKP